MDEKFINLLIKLQFKASKKTTRFTQNTTKQQKNSIWLPKQTGQTNSNLKNKASNSRINKRDHDVSRSGRDLQTLMVVSQPTRVNHGPAFARLGHFALIANKTTSTALEILIGSIQCNVNCIRWRVVMRLQMILLARSISHNKVEHCLRWLHKNKTQLIKPNTKPNTKPNAESIFTSWKYPRNIFCCMGWTNFLKKVNQCSWKATWVMWMSTVGTFS